MNAGKIRSVLHVCAGLSSGGGIAESVPALAQKMKYLGVEATIATVSGKTNAEQGGAVVPFQRSRPLAVFFSFQMFTGLRNLVKGVDVVHVHSNWTFPVWWGSFLAKRYGKILVMSPRGCLDPVRLQHSAWKKKLVGWLDRWCFRHADIIHVTSEMERQWVVGFLGRRVESKIRVIPNGVSIPDEILVQQNNSENVRKVLYLGRLHPLKGLDLLLKAWKEITLCRDCGQWELLIVGPDEQGMLSRLKHLAEDLSLTYGMPHEERKSAAGQVRFSGKVEGTVKWGLLSGVDILVLPSLSENFGNVVAEALACGIPVVTTRGTPWQKVEEVGCGVWVETTVAGIHGGLAKLMGMSDGERKHMGRRGREWIRREFSWEQAARHMVAEYQGVADMCAGG